MTNTQNFMPVMDLVVPIHGQLEMNQVFTDYLIRNTRNPFHE